MKIRHALVLGILLFLFACQAVSPAQVTIVDGDQIQIVKTSEQIPLVILTQAGFNITNKDRVYSNGIPVALDQAMLQAGSVTLQIRHAATLTLVTPEGQKTIQTSATTVGEALSEAGFQLLPNDLIDPPAETPLDNLLIIKYTPAHSLTVSADGKSIQARSSAGTVGEALAEAGIPLLGLDYSSPSENEALPGDGQIRVVRVAESLQLFQKPVAFKSETMDSPDLELGQQQVLEPGEAGLSVSRVRIRHENGVEVSRKTESETIVRPPKNRVVVFGTKIVLKTATIDGVTIQYWHAMSMYATSYSPCKSGVPGQCFSGTSLGLPVKRGVVAMDISMYNALAGQQLFIPGYGRATVADVGGGSIIEKNLGVARTKWIDLGYSDNDWQEWGTWVTVYFLAPAPVSIPYLLQ